MLSFFRPPQPFEPYCYSVYRILVHTTVRKAGIMKYWSSRITEYWSSWITKYWVGLQNTGPVENKILVKGARNTSPTELSKKERKLPGSSRKLPRRKGTITAVSGSISLASLNFLVSLYLWNPTLIMLP